MGELVFKGAGGGHFAYYYAEKTSRCREDHSRRFSFKPRLGARRVNTLIEYGTESPKVRAILISYLHPEHYANTEVLVEAMTWDTNRRRNARTSKRLFRQRVLDQLSPSITEQMPERGIEVKTENAFNLGGIKIALARKECRRSDNNPRNLYQRRRRNSRVKGEEIAEVKNFGNN